MDTKVDLEHIKSLKEFSRDEIGDFVNGEFARNNPKYFGRSLIRTSTEDPNIYMVNLDTREGFDSYIIVVGRKSFAFGIENRLGQTLQKTESAESITVWVDEILCDVVDHSPSEGTYISFANQFSFSSSKERDVIIDLLGNLVVAMGEPDPTGRDNFLPQRLMFTERAKKQLAAYDDQPTHFLSSSSGLSRRSKKRQGKWMRFLRRDFRRQGD